MQVDQREDQGLEVLDEVVEDTQTLRVGRFLNILERSDLGRLQTVSPVVRSYGWVAAAHALPIAKRNQRSYLKRDVLVSKSDLELLTAVLVLLRPFGIVLPAAPLVHVVLAVGLETHFKISLSLTIRRISFTTA